MPTLEYERKPSKKKRYLLLAIAAALLMGVAMTVLIVATNSPKRRWSATVQFQVLPTRPSNPR